MVTLISLNSELILNYDEDMSKLLNQVQSSELSRNAAEVFEQAQKSPLVITRRDGQNLVLKSLREELAQLEARAFASSMLSAALETSGSIQERVKNHFPWILALSDKDQAECVTELLQAARIALATGQDLKAMQLLTSWRETALAVAAGLTASANERLKTPIKVERAQ